jgi:hypothetical protein
MVLLPPEHHSENIKKDLRGCLEDPEEKQPNQERRDESNDKEYQRRLLCVVEIKQKPGDAMKKK